MALTAQRITEIQAKIRGFEFYQLKSQEIDELCDGAITSMALIMQECAKTATFGDEKSRRSMIAMLDQMLETFLKIIVATGVNSGSETTRQQARMVAQSLIDILSPLVPPQISDETQK